MRCPTTCVLFLLLLTPLTACVQHSYSGGSYIQNDPANVRVYSDAGRVPSGMQEIGTDRATADGSVDEERIVNDLVRKAASVGADAVLIERSEVIETRPEGSGRKAVTTTQPVLKTRVITARFYRTQ